SFAQNFQRNLPSQSPIFGAPHLAHSAFAEARHHAVMLNGPVQHDAFCIIGAVQFKFDAFLLDAAARELRRGREPIHLSPKAFELVRTLIEARPAAISKQDLHRQLWPDTFVTDTSLATTVNELRTALDDSARQPRYIRTVHAYGYAFC